jgi:hypothetical protein
VLRTYDKVRKVGRALELNGITASNELRRQKEKVLARQKLQDERRVIARYGPISAGDARSRIATDDYNRRAAQTRLSELNGKLFVTKRLSYGVGFASSEASFEKE